MAARIVKLIPEHKHYGEPFAGAGWVFFRKEPSRYESLNDINGDLVAFYRVLRFHLEEFCKEFRFLLSSREWFEDFKRQIEARGLTDIQKAARFYYLQRHCFGGRVNGRTYGVSRRRPPVNLASLETELSEAHIRLTHVRIENLPWADYLARYDAPDTFFFIDPPYCGSEHVYGRGLFGKDDYPRMAEHLAGLKGKFIMTLNDLPLIHESFQYFTIRPVETSYSVARDGNKAAREVLISNLDLPSRIDRARA